MKRSTTIQAANENQPAASAVLLLAPVIDILARQAVRMVKPANDNRSADASADLSPCSKELAP